MFVQRVELEGLPNSSSADSRTATALAGQQIGSTDTLPKTKMAAFHWAFPRGLQRALKCPN